MIKSTAAVLLLTLILSSFSCKNRIKANTNNYYIENLHAINALIKESMLLREELSHISNEFMISFGSANNTTHLRYPIGKTRGGAMQTGTIYFKGRTSTPLKEYQAQFDSLSFKSSVIKIITIFGKLERVKAVASRYDNIFLPMGPRVNHGNPNAESGLVYMINEKCELDSINKCLKFHEAVAL